MFCKRIKKSEWTAHLTIGCLFLIGLLAAGCVEVVDDNSGDNGDVNKQVQVLSEDGGSKAEWAHEELFFRFKGVDGHPHVYCLQTLSGAHYIQGDQSKGSQIDFQDFSDKTNLDCQAFLRGGSPFVVRTPQGPIKSLLPEDLVYTGDTELDLQFSEPQSIRIESQGRIFMKNGTFSTNGKNLLIKSHEVFFENVIIRNFVKRVTAPDEKSGQSGGHIRIESSRASGVLVLDMRGQNGGRGKSGLAGVGWTKSGGLANGLDGSPGKNGGATGDLAFEIQNSSGLLLDVRMVAGAGGPGGIGGEGASSGTSACDPFTYICTPTKPVFGPSGQPGASGSSGFRGACSEIRQSSHRLCPLQ
ncbi:MAG: hypothetical protein ACK5P7_04060 [Bdellovibrio sp.]